MVAVSTSTTPRLFFARAPKRALRPRSVYLLAFAAILAACGSDGKVDDADPGNGTGSRTDGGGQLGGGGDGGGQLGGGGGDAALSTFALEPLDPVLNVNGSPASQAFSALIDGAVLPSASWSLDNPRLGSIDSDGVFRSAGLVAGTGVVTARYGAYEASTTIHVVSTLTHTADGVTPEQKDLLDGAPSAPAAAFRWLYPYDNTVFPRGLSAPEMQFGDGAADALRVSVSMGDFTFQGYFPGAAYAAAALPEDVWEALTLSADGMVPVDVEVTKLSGGTASGPIAQQWRIAPGDLKGIVYYNTYDSPLANGGAVMRIRPGSDAEVLQGGCTVCHSVSAQGNVLAAGVQWGSDNPIDSTTFDLRDDGSSPVRYDDADGRKFSFAGLVPDGSWLIGNGVPQNSPVRGMRGTLESKLYDSATGLEVAAPSFTDKVKFAVTPTFSPDGKRLAFSWFDQGQGNGRQLAMMDVDLTINPPAFGAVQTVTRVSSGIAGWPSFFPDGKGILFQDGQHFDTGLHGGGATYSELRLADTEDATADGATIRRLEALNGWLAANDSYLPYGADEENRRNYEPSVIPVPVGGYYWVLFTSRRAYGHALAPGGSVPGSDDEWGIPVVEGEENPSVRKKLWVAAIDIDYTGKVDPSHPAFYLPGQELLAGNMRAFSALEPCRSEGDDCASGADCCGGFCRYVQSGDIGEPVPVCVPPPVGCSNIDETCQTNADCCGVATGDICINNRCAAPNVYLQ